MSTIRTPEDEIDKPGWFYPPFREGWHYLGATYPGHSDHSVDFNRRTPSGGWLNDDGDPVLAAADGTVAEVDKADGLVLLNHHGGLWRTEYRHMKDIVVKTRDKVQRGDRIGSIGNVAGSGASFGSHLHHVHWKRDRTGRPFRRTQMRFEGQPVATSVASGSKPAGWTPPQAQFVIGPPPKATWRSAYREAAKALDRRTEERDAAKALTALVTDERDQARRDLTAAQARIAELEQQTPPDCTAAVRDGRLALLAEIRTALEGVAA